MPDFFAYLTCLCSRFGQNFTFLTFIGNKFGDLNLFFQVLQKNSVHGFAFSTKNSPYTELFLLEWNFLFFALDVKHNVLHLLGHKLVGEVCVYSSYQSFRAVTHPNIDDIGANVLLTNGCKGMT